MLAVLAGATGGICWLALGPAPLAFPLYAFLMLRALRHAATDRQAALIGVLWGIARYAVASHFLLALMRYSVLGIAFYLIAIVYIVPYAVVEAWGAFRMERITGVTRSVWVALLYPLMEWLRTVGDLSFPADLMVHGLGTFPAWLGWSPWIGPFGIPLLVFAVGALLEAAWERRHGLREAAPHLAAALLLWAGPAMTSAVASAPQGKGGDALRVAVVQPCASVEDKHDPRRRSAAWQTLERLTVAAAKGADLVVWPETARPGRVRWDAPAPFHDELMETLSRQVGVPILYGCEIVRVEGDTVSLYNGAALVHPDGKAASWYGKQHLMPLVEGIPFASLVGWDPASRARGRSGESSYLSMLGNFTPGPPPTVFEVAGARIGVLICYEGQYPQLARAYRRQGANLLVVLTNDAWWGRSVFPGWHAQMIAARARETGLPVVRAANNGVSSFTDASGRLRERAELDEVTVLRAEVRPAGDGPTTYVRTAPALIVSAWIPVGTGAVVGLWRRRRRRSGGPQ